MAASRPSAACPKCGRKFILERLQGHVALCVPPLKPVAPPRPVQVPGRGGSRGASGPSLRIKWEREEFVLALGLYKQVGAEPDETHPSVIALARLLRRRLASRYGTLPPEVRSAEAVSMKIRGFLQFERGSHADGLQNSGRLAEETWKTFGSSPERLASEVKRITDFVEATGPGSA